MIRFTTAVLSLGFLLSSCHFWGGKHMRGNGNIKHESRPAGQFSKVDVSNSFEVHVKQDSARSVNIETDENLLGYIIVETDGDRLKIYSENNYNLDPTNGGKVKVYVSSPVFTRLEASGACSFVGDNVISSDSQLDVDLSGASKATLQLDMPKITVGLSGASRVILTGKTKDFSIDAAGASHANCFDLLSENANVDLAGASSAEVFASVTINASASGASKVRYKGNATLGSKHESGASSVEKTN